MWQSRRSDTDLGRSKVIVGELRNCKVSRKRGRILLAAIGEARLTSKLCPCDLHENTRSKGRVRGQFGHFGLWLSLVERLVRDQEAVGSNPTSPIHSIGKM